MTQDEARTAILAYAFSGSMSPVAAKSVTYGLLAENSTAFTWTVALEDENSEAEPRPIDRYSVKIDRRTREICNPEPIVISESELEEAVLAATSRRMRSSSRFTDGGLSISYKVNVHDHPEQYVVQMRHHGKVASMDSIMRLISRTINPSILPLPAVYPIPQEMERQDRTGFGRQIADLVPGQMADSVYYSHLSHQQRLNFVQRVALAFQACWE